ncbi:MAG: ornithine cyclodeaminase family protein [Pseudomonadota bacterium]
MRFISDQEVARCLDFPAVIGALEQAFESLAHRRAAIKARTRIDCGNVKLSSMGALWLDAGLAGEKVYPTVEGRYSFLFNLFDIEQGRPLAVMEANELTRLRTAGLTAMVARRCAGATRKLALFGAGVQGRAHLEALAHALPFEQVDVVDPLDQSAWCAEASRRFGLAVRQRTPDEAVDDADLVVTVTRSRTPVFDGTRLRPGAFVAAVGTSLPTGRELDDATLSRAGRIIVEWRPQSGAEAGELVLGRLAGAVDDARIVDLAELFAGQARWRAAEQEIVVFKSVGVGLADLAAASLAWKVLRDGAATGQPA